jgi:hypothetical protein
MESHLVNAAKMMDWYAQLEAGKRQNSSNYREGEHCLAVPDPQILR